MSEQLASSYSSKLSFEHTAARTKDADGRV